MSSYLDFAEIGAVLQKVKDAGGILPAAAFPRSAHETNEPDLYSRAREWRHDLSWGISWAYTVHECFPDWTSDSRSRRRIDRLVEVRTHAEKLVSALCDEDLSLTPYLQQQFEVGQSTVELTDMLEQLARAAKAEVAWLSEGGLDVSAPLSKNSGYAPYPTEGMGYIAALAKAYRKAFGADAAIQYDAAREPTGPFIAFVMASQSAVEATGTAPPIANTPGAIDQAFKRWRRWSDSQSK